MLSSYPSIIQCFIFVFSGVRWTPVRPRQPPGLWPQGRATPRGNPSRWSAVQRSICVRSTLQDLLSAPPWGAVPSSPTVIILSGTLRHNDSHQQGSQSSAKTRAGEGKLDNIHTFCIHVLDMLFVYFSFSIMEIISDMIQTMEEEV